MYLLHLMDVRNYFFDATPGSAATSLLIPGNLNWKGKYFTSGTYPLRKVST
jgi:hypothetical protein